MGSGRVLSLQQTADSWQALGVPDATGPAALPELIAGERRIDWSSVLGGGEQQPHLRLEMSQETAPLITRTWDVDSKPLFTSSIKGWTSTVSLAQTTSAPLLSRNGAIDGRPITQLG